MLDRQCSDHAASQSGKTPPAGLKKPWWQSKTVWFNTIVAALLLAEQRVDALQGFAPEWLHQLAVFSLPIVNMGLRVISSQGLSFQPNAPTGEADQ